MTRRVPIPIPGKNPYPETGYGSLPGPGLGNPEIPRGYPLQSLVPVKSQVRHKDIKAQLITPEL